MYIPIIPPMDDIWWCEACAGEGAILRLMPPDKRIGFDINPPLDNPLGIIQADFRLQLLDPAHTWGVLSNGPFRRMPGDSIGGPHRLFAWAAAQRPVVFIGLIVPDWFNDPRTKNSLDPYFHLVHVEELPTDSFTRNGDVKFVAAMFMVWVRRAYQREPIPIPLVHPDWLWLPYGRLGEADAWMQCWGVGYGDIKDPDRPGRINDPRNHFLIKEIRAGTIARLRAINWTTIAWQTTTTPRLTKHQVVKAYTDRYGDGAEAADASAAIAAKAGSWPSHLTAAIIAAPVAEPPVAEPPVAEPPVAEPPTSSPPSPEGDPWRHWTVHGFVDAHVARVRAGGHPMTIADHLEADGCDDGLTMIRVSGQISRRLKPGAQYHQHRDTVYVMPAGPLARPLLGQAPQRGRPKKIKE